jgi:hypothetical protein
MISKAFSLLSVTFALILLQAFIMHTSIAYASRGSGDFSSGSSKTDSSRHSGLDDGTPDQGRGDFTVTGLPIVSSGNDDGTPDQGRGDFTATGARIITPGSDDGTPDQGRGDFTAAGVRIATSDSDDGTQDQGRGDFNVNGERVDNSSSDDGSSSGGDDRENRGVLFGFRNWLAATFNWMFFR